MTDSLGAAVSGAEVSIVDGLAVMLARGQTDERGALALTIPRTGDDHELVVRRIGYRRADVFFNDTNPNVVFDVRLRRLIATLDTVRVTAAEDVRRKSYFIDAEAIELEDVRSSMRSTSSRAASRYDLGPTGKPDRHRPARIDLRAWIVAERAERHSSSGENG